MCLAASVIWPSDVALEAVVCSCGPFLRRVVERVAILEAISIGARDSLSDSLGVVNCLAVG